MPIYEYSCTNCNHQLEALQGLSDSPLLVCPACDASALVKGIFSAPNFQLKGSGWYKTDYAKSSSNQNSDQSSGATSAGDKGSESVKQDVNTASE